MARTQTGIAFEKIAGKMADGVAYGHRGGTALRSLPHYRYPLQPSQREANERLKRANALFNSLDERETDLWTRYGEKHKKRDPMSGALYASPAKNLLVGFACKLLQIDPDAALPRLPPEGAFVGDSCGITVTSPSPSGSSLREGRGERDEEPTGPLPQPPLRDEPLGEGALIFTAARPSDPGVLTELMAQPLKNVRVRPKAFYKSRGFATFVEGGLTVLLPLPPGVYAVAVQSVEASSGRLAGFTTLGKVTVEAPPTPG